jgi:hypothetical protein
MMLATTDSSAEIAAMVVLDALITALTAISL